MTKGTPHIQPNGVKIAKTVLMPGDPLRAKYIADNFLENVEQFNDVRNMFGYTGTYKGKEVSVMGSGMGIPSIGIYSYELYNFFDVDTIIRIGSCGALQENVNLYDVIIAQAASTNSNYVDQYNIPGHFAPIADFEVVTKAKNVADQIGATTVSISCNEHAVISEIAQYPVEVKVGPEVLTGSTRLKSGTAQKLILNMISTITMVGVGKVYDNLMIDVKATNQKLIDRSVRIIQEICAITYDEAMALYQVSEHDVKVATVMGMCGISKEEATRRLLNNGDIVKRAIRDRQP